MIADLCVLGVVVLFIALGYRAGFVRSCVNLASFVLSIVISLLVYPVISSLLAQTQLYTFFVDFIKNSGLAEGAALAENGVFNVFSGALQGAVDGVAGSIALLIINIISFILMIIVSKLVLSMITHLLDIFAKLPVIKQFNRLGGSVLGGVIGIAVVYLILAVAVVAVPLDSAGNVAREIEESEIASQMYNNNILLSMIDKGE